MNNVKLLIAGSAFFAMSAQAADRVSIDVKVTLEAAACTPILSTDESPNDFYQNH